MRWPYTEKEMRKKQNPELDFQTLQFCIQNPFSVGVQITFPERLNNSSQLIITLIRQWIEKQRKSHTIYTPFDNFDSETTGG
jgi:hypothetical protein